MSDDSLPEGTDLSTRVYDYLKHLTTLSLVAIGGVLGLLQGQVKIPPRAAVVTILMLGASGVVSLMTLNFTLHLESVGRMTPGIRKAVVYLQQLATALLMLGLGMFLGAFLKVIR